MEVIADETQCGSRSAESRALFVSLVSCSLRAEYTSFVKDSIGHCFYFLE